MIAGTGVDMVDISRIKIIHQKFGIRFAKKILHAVELEKMPSNACTYLAGRLAAKEAAVKALGTGFANGIAPTHIEIHNGQNGKPGLYLHGPALLRARQIGVSTFHLSISHERGYAIAMVILET